MGKHEMHQALIVERFLAVSAQALGLGRCPARKASSTRMSVHVVGVPQPSAPWAAMGTIMDQLGQELGVLIELFPSPDKAAAMRALHHGQADGVWLLACEPSRGAEPSAHEVLVTAWPALPWAMQFWVGRSDWADHLKRHVLTFLLNYGELSHEKETLAALGIAGFTRASAAGRQPRRQHRYPLMPVPCGGRDQLTLSVGLRT